MKKQASKKRAAKKAPAKKGWKDWRSLLIRLDDRHNKVLENIMNATGEKTAAGAIKIMLEEYLPMRENVKYLQEQMQVNKYNLTQYQEAIKRFSSAFEGLTKVKPIQKIQRNIFDEIGEEEQ